MPFVKSVNLFRKPGQLDLEAEALLQGARVCLVDDDPRQKGLVERCFEGLDVDLRAFTDGRSALAFLSKHKVDFVLSDVMMPDMDGWELHSRLRASVTNRNTPVIFVTCLIREVQEQGMSDPASRCVSVAKPLSRKSVLRAVAQICLEGDFEA